MPIVGVNCPQCGYVEDIVPMKSAPRIGDDYVCPDCGIVVKSCFTRGEIDCGEHVRLSRALALHPAQMVDGTAQKMHPGANFVKTEGGMFALEIRSRADKLRRIRERSHFTGKNFEERD